MNRHRSESVLDSATDHRFLLLDPDFGAVLANYLLLLPAPAPGAVLPILPCRSAPGSGAVPASYLRLLGPVLATDSDLLGFGSGAALATIPLRLGPVPATVLDLLGFGSGTVPAS